MNGQHPLHLMMSMSALASSTFACEWLSSACKNLNLSDSQKQTLNQLPSAVSQQAQAKYQNLLKAVELYTKHPVPTQRINAPTIWRKGSARLLDFGIDMSAPASAHVLIVPSLINRYYILDLSEKRSLIGYLRKQGIYPLVLDWDEPGETESQYNMADYVTNILLPAIKFSRNSTGYPLHLLGYCLGGVLSLAAAQLLPDDIASLGLLATPWDFKSEDTHSPTIDKPQLEWIKDQILAAPTVQPIMFEWLFMLRQPFVFEHKFSKMTQIKNPSELKEFIQVEQWVNDSVPMASPAAADCLIHWAQHNDLHQGNWQVAGQSISPAQIPLPGFLAIPSQDNIVPTQCANALASKLPKREIHQPNAGHVGMVVGRKAKKELWEPYVKFILNQ